MKSTPTTAALLDYLEGLTVSQGRMAGLPFPVLPWERRFIRGAFAPHAIESALSVGRGNGKTTLTAGIAAAALDGPLVMPRSETVIVASSFEQGRISFGHVYAFLQEVHGDELQDKRKWRVWDSANKAWIQNRENGAIVKAIGSDPRRAHGLAPGLVLADEPAQWEPSRSEAMIAALRTGLGKIPNGRLIALGTRPADAQHWFSQMLDGGGDYSQVHMARPDDPPFRKRTWARANPSLDFMPDLERTIRREAFRARQGPERMASFRALRLNLGTSDVVSQYLLAVETWRRIEGQADAVGKPYWGVDLGTSAAQSAVVAYWPSTGRLEALAAFPVEPSLEDRGVSDGVGRLYAECARRGELITTGGSAVDISELLTAALDLFGTPAGIASDRWREAELRDALKAARIPLTRLSMRGQGWKDGSARMCANSGVLVWKGA